MHPTVPQTEPSAEAAARARRTILAALHARADQAKRTANGRHLAGAERAALRAEWREYSRYLRELAGQVEHADLAALGALLTGAGL